MSFITLVIWAILIAATYKVADNQGRNGVLWALLAVIFPPIIVLPVLLILGEPKK